MAVFVGTVYPNAVTSVSGDNAISVATTPGGNTAPRVLRIQNNTAQDIYIAYDKAANLGSHVVSAGTTFEDTANACLVLHIYTVSSGLSINGTTTGGIVVWGIL